MTTWITATRATRLSARRHDAARSTSLTALPCACEADETLEPREHDPLRLNTDPTIQLTLACPAADRKSSAWHPWEG